MASKKLRVVGVFLFWYLKGERTWLNQSNKAGMSYTHIQVTKIK